MPLYGDMQINVMSWVKLSPNWDASKWSLGTDAGDKTVQASQHNIVARLESFRLEYNSLIADLTVLRTKVGCAYAASLLFAMNIIGMTQYLQWLSLSDGHPSSQHALYLHTCIIAFHTLYTQVIHAERVVGNNEKLSDMALRGLKTVAGWNATIMELV